MAKNCQLFSQKKSDRVLKDVKDKIQDCHKVDLGE